MADKDRRILLATLLVSLAANIALCLVAAEIDLEAQAWRDRAAVAGASSRSWEETALAAELRMMASREETAIARNHFLICNSMLPAAQRMLR